MLGKAHPGSRPGRLARDVVGGVEGAVVVDVVNPQHEHTIRVIEEARVPGARDAGLVADEAGAAAENPADSVGLGHKW